MNGLGALRPYVGIGVSIGVLAALWTQVSGMLGLLTWVGFVAWACYFAAGAGGQGLLKGLAANLSGVAWAFLLSLVLPLAAFDGWLALLVGVLALVLCLQAAVPVLAFIPGAFVGAAVLFGTQFAVWPTVVALVVGALLGHLSGVLGGRLQTLVDSRTRPATAVA